MDVQPLKIANVENIELNVDSTNKNKFVFPDIENLRGKEIVGIAIPSVGNVTKSPLGKALVNATVYKYSFLVLNIKGKERVNRMPLPMLDPKDNGGNIAIFDSQVVDWPKSYIEVGDKTGLSTSETYFVLVYYKDPK